MSVDPTRPESPQLTSWRPRLKQKCAPQLNRQPQGTPAGGQAYTSALARPQQLDPVRCDHCADQAAQGVRQHVAQTRVPSGHNTPLQELDAQRGKSTSDNHGTRGQPGQPEAERK